MVEKNSQKKLVVIGGGAAGFFCAINAAKLNPKLKIIILEKTNKLLSKVKISGGGRCNVTHANFSISSLVKNYPRGDQFLKKAFHQFNTQHTIHWFLERGVELKTESDGRMFPVSNSSETIVNCLIKEANKYNIEIKYHSEVKSLERKDSLWNIFCNNEIIIAKFVCIASGGFAKEESFNWIKKLGIE
jgi:predicted Rossmann fold flavoprotein